MGEFVRVFAGEVVGTRILNMQNGTIIHLTHVEKTDIRVIYTSASELGVFVETRIPHIQHGTIIHVTHVNRTDIHVIYTSSSELGVFVGPVPSFRPGAAV